MGEGRGNLFKNGRKKAGKRQEKNTLSSREKREDKKKRLVERSSLTANTGDGKQTEKASERVVEEGRQKWR